MKKEVAFFKDKRNKPNAKNIIKLFRFLGYTDAQIIEEMKKWKANGETSHPAQDDGYCHCSPSIPATTANVCTFCFKPR